MRARAEALAEQEERQTLGLELVDALVHQVGGVLTRGTGVGCRVKIVFAERSAR